jgi:hypothetical protein
MRSGFGPKSGVEATGPSITSPALIVLLIIVLGATIYLWRQRYIRRKTAYMTMAVLIIAIIGVGYLMYGGVL